jgi:Fe-S oxidoreductase
MQLYITIKSILGFLIYIPASKHLNLLAAACPFCITMLTDRIADLEGDGEVKDIAEILDEATN